MVVLMMLQGSRVHTNKVEGLMTKFVMSSKWQVGMRESYEGNHKRIWFLSSQYALGHVSIPKFGTENLPFGPCLFAVSVATFRKLRGSPI